jgi:hypothetical protein
LIVGIRAFVETLGLECIASWREEAGEAFFKEGPKAHEAGADYCGVDFDF